MKTSYLYKDDKNRNPRWREKKSDESLVKQKTPIEARAIKLVTFWTFRSQRR